MAWGMRYLGWGVLLVLLVVGGCARSQQGPGLGAGDGDGDGDGLAHRSRVPGNLSDPKVRGGSVDVANPSMGPVAGDAAWEDDPFGEDFGTTGDGFMEPWDETQPNWDCPEYPPYMGPGAAEGECCRRGETNRQRLDKGLGGPMWTAEYRLNMNVPVDHPESISLPVLVSLALNRADNQEQSMLWRFEVPFDNGKLASGPGYVTIGSGQYNCDGTHSFFGPKAAPVRMSALPMLADPSRWAPRRIPAFFEVDANAVVRMRQGLAGRDLDPMAIPFFNSDTFAYEWDMIVQDTRLSDDVSLDGDRPDCLGVRSGSGWRPAGTYRSHLPVADNHVPDNGIPVLGFQTLSQLVAFGLLTGDELAERDPLDVSSRCMPELDLPRDERMCPWVRLPNALCPETDAEKALFGCHLGWSLEGVREACSYDPPTTAVAPDDGIAGQCCSPLGHDGLPVCNAWVVTSEYVAASAEITGDSRDGGPTRCQ